MKCPFTSETWNVWDILTNAVCSDTIDTILYGLLALVIFRLNFYFKFLSHDSER